MDLSFDNVIRYYYDKGESPNSINSFNINLDPIKNWLENQLKINDGKNVGKSILLRKEGNEFFRIKSLQKCLECYNASICCAPVLSEEYFLATANRAAVTFELKKYSDCLTDLESCLNSSTYPENLRSKLERRKDECIKKLGGHSGSITNEDSYELPSFKDGENANFAYASSIIGIRYNKEKGRHVVAKQHITKGEILFLEKAFASGSIFNQSSRRINVLKCYKCLKNIYSGIPCEHCVKCMFCNSQCRDESWKESHRWECRGMLGDIWYHLGIAFPAFRALLKGVNSGFKEVEMMDIKYFGNKEDNYPFFNSLTFAQDDKSLEVSIMSITVTQYLKEHTDYFDWFLSQPKNKSFSEEHITNFLENQLSKHILQFQNNSSIIEHWLEAETLPLEKQPVACGIFPAVSIMNHSCKPNVTNYFVCDTIVVKALEDINENEEVFNCYGISYRKMNRDQRQEACRQQYHFECKCVVCSDPNKEMHEFDSSLCPSCGFSLDIPDLTLTLTVCKKCESVIEIPDLNKRLILLALTENVNDVESLQDSLVAKEKVLTREHNDLQRIRFELYTKHGENGNYKEMLKYFEEWYNVEKIRNGQDVHPLGFHLHEIGFLLSSKFNTTTGVKDEYMISKARELIAEAKRICLLYYPSQIIDRIKWE